MYEYLLAVSIILILFYFLLDFIYSYTKFNINKIYEYHNIITDDQINEIIKLSAPLVAPSPVIGEGGQNTVMNNVRTSHNTFLSDKYPVVQNVYDKLSNIIGIDKSHFEDLQVVRYHPGQLYKAHWDACYEESKCDDFLKRGGNRYATFLLYLNDDFQGGETHFPLRNKKIIPEKGKAALFFNLDENNIDKLENSKHAGLPPTSGIKWMCNVWIRQNKIPEQYKN